MLLHRSGAVSPAVLFLSGAGLIGLNCFNIQDEISHRTTSILYDRSGTGWIDDIPLPGAAGEVAEELRTLLNAAQVPPPYLLVAHSLAEAYARRYAQLFPGERHTKLQFRGVEFGRKPKLWPHQIAQAR